MSINKKIIHLTSAHPRYDVRIFGKQCLSLKKLGFEVCLIVADGLNNENKLGIEIYDVGKFKTRLQRIFKAPKYLIKRAIDLNGHIYHLHDPELTFIGLKLRKLGFSVIFDAHEDLPKQVLGKPYLNWLSKKILSKLLGIFELYSMPKFNAIITATPSITKKFKIYCKHVVTINNYPHLGELVMLGSLRQNKRDKVAYIGGISEIRGIKEILLALQKTKSEIRLQLAGEFNSLDIEYCSTSHISWKRVDYHGLIERSEIGSLLNECIAGLVLFLPLPNHIDAQPNKMFEYMSAGIPVICSNFTLWKDIVESYKCGICVDPSNPSEIADAIDFLYENPELASQMGNNGLRAVRETYNWNTEEIKLKNLYSELLSSENKQ